ncbi:MAG: hypothetical protein PF487_09050 [Bacteroidales bacterium]|jgi:hypothetical protein|nr:hypothetical protein [Bacteroidales bacterium]
MDLNELKEQVQKASNIIESVDEVVTNELVKSQHASDKFKENQRISNYLLRVIRAIDDLKFEL